ncbi:mRNA guanylyltransferase [Panaeolus papilionaceus]|nr:mRNA guanylyltransferase [Panaeolus papilionaceus]
MPIPDLPGVLLERYSDQERYLKQRVMRMCQLEHERQVLSKFPGSQPVSFATRDLEKLESQDYWVCEKSDGIRVLFLINTDSNVQTVYIVDRHNTYRELHGFFFPHHEDPRRELQNTLIDGELVIDVDPQTKQETLRFLAFDCLVIDGQNVMTKPLDKRYGRLTEWFYKPYRRMIQDHPHVLDTHPFHIKVKEINFSYHVEKVFNVDIPALQHGNDGLIYTCVNAPYTAGTDKNILKWKPPSENSIDFKLVLRFPPAPHNPSEPDWHAKPLFLLYVWCGDERGQPKYELYDEMYVEDDEWEELKKSGEQIDERVVEVHWEPQHSRWRRMRFRDDKPRGNHRSVVENIIDSIADGVEQDALLARSNAIRAAWKHRLGQPQQPIQAQGSQSMRPPPVPASASFTRPPPPPNVQYRYGPLAQSRWSKVSGPPVVAGMKR